MKRWHIGSVSALVLAVLIAAVACQQAPPPASPAAAAATKAPAAPPPTVAAAPPTAAAATAPSQPAPTAAAATGPVQEIKAGIGTALSGASAPLGILLGRTYELVGADIGTFTVAGKSYKWNVIVADHQYTSAGGVATANRFINQDGVKFIYQLGTAPAQAVQPIAEASKVIYDASASDRTILGPKFPYTFRAYQSPNDTYPAFITYLMKNQPQLKNWYIMPSDDASGAAIADSSRQIIKKYGLNLAGETAYPRETTDFYPVLAKVLPTKPDVIITMSADAVATLVKQSRELGYTGKFLASGAPAKLSQVAGVKYAEGYMSPGADLWSTQTPKALIDFAQKYKAKHNEEWIGSGMIAWPTLYLITDAMKQAGTVDDSAKIAKTMETAKLNTPLGQLFYGEQELYGAPHQLVLPVWITEFKDGKMTTIATVPPEEAVKAAVEVFK